uniref:Unconventional myosin-VIIa-like n=1 Tax=Neolamprologus brichardi TaxID=32507 RepID=A0A3Q4HB86_NEOBR
SFIFRLSPGDFVWVDTGTGVPIGAEVKVTDTGQIQLLDDEGKEHKLKKTNEKSIRPMHPTSVKGVDDMIRLGDLNEAGLLRNLLVRHKEGIIYTYTGSILVAVNPYQLLPIYTIEHVHMYTDRRLGELPPHVFSIADSCFFNMRRNRKNQCCVISGESGAGKTESTKLMLQFLAAVSGQRSWIEQQVLEANPILEAFGNAKTIRNDNSSRFGKYIDINFTKGGAIEGARIEQYLLEKSRVCRQAPDERNYHVFYYMLMGMSAEKKKILSLGNAAEYKYLTMGNCTSCEGRDDVKEYAHFQSALKILTFTENDLWEISKLLAAILHLGNVDFEEIILSDCATLLPQVDPKALGKGLTQRSFQTAREHVTKSLTSAQAMDGRDAFVKGIYGRLFIWIVEKINSAIYKPPDEENEAKQSIGLLDIFGFENFSKNSFEQLCINFANEQLQQFFVKHVFKLEQDEYARENIVWKHIDYQDNQRTLDVLASKSMNLLSLIDEESNFPKATDATLLQKMNQYHEKGGIYLPPKNNYETQFGIEHFAGKVFYDSQGFLEKNRDTLSSDLIKMLEKSTNKLLKQVFCNDLKSTSGIPDGKKRVPTLSGQFRQSLDSLMKTLTACQPYFIRCIKPNDFKKPMLFDRELCMRQLRYSGMMETIRIRKAGYPVRYTFDEFLTRYRVLLRTSICDPKTVRNKMVISAVFFQDHHDTMLEVERIKQLNVKALLIQKVLRGYKYRKEFLRKRSAAIVIQKYWRGHKGRKLYKVQLGFARLQAQVRSRQLHFQYKKRRQATLVVQTHVRGHLARKEWKRKRKAVILLQAHTRGILARKALEKMKRDVSCPLLRAMFLLFQMYLSAKRQSDQEMVDDMFDFLTLMPNTVGGQEGQAPMGYENFGGKRVIEEIDIDEIQMEEDLPNEDYDDLDEYSFAKFASMYFQGAATHTHIRQRLHQPLLYHEDEDDVLASLTVWWIILRFMGDLPEPKKRARVPSSQDLSKPATLQTVKEDPEVLTGESDTLDRPLTSLEKLHYIVGYAIVRPDLRDEIYCQICKQLHDNNNRTGFFRGWVLLSLCLGVFPPSERFIKYLQSFIRLAPSGYSSYCADRLRRTVMNGTREEPPSYLELQATKTKKPIVVTVMLMDNRSINLPVDSASTSKEICQLISNKINLKDSFGFSIYVALYAKVWALGSGREHVMDAISRCEQDTKRRGGQEQHAPWRLIFRKEIFTPWHNCSDDKLSTDLIYKQIIHGLKSGEYQCQKEDDYVDLAAKHLYIQHGSDSRPENVKDVVQDCISNSLLETKTESNWVQMVSTAHAQVSHTDSLKAEIVDYTRQKWPIFFSRFFEVAKLSGPPLPKSKFIVAINWTGITFLDEREKRLAELSFPEVMAVNAVSLVTLKGDFTLSGPSAADMAELITMFVSGLTERSQYAVALKEVEKQDATFLSFKKGELIMLIKDNDFSQDHGWVKGQNDRTKQTGAVPIDAITILLKAKCSGCFLFFQNLINLSPNQRKDIIQATMKETGTVGRIAPYSLKDFSDVNRQVISRNAAPERLWVHSREPMRQPLLKKLGAILDCCVPILKYMGDYPTKQQQNPLELTDQIFGPATKHDALRDEIYCQIMKQMTNNNNRFSMEHGWQLMWLSCGLFPPSQPLLKHAQRFLESRRREPLASDCLQRMQSSLRMEPRKLPPHHVELDAIQQNSTQIRHKIHFPNDTDEIFEVATNTRIKDLLLNISRKLELSSADGFSIFVKTNDKFLSLNETDYFFDSLRQITDWSKSVKRIDGGLVNYTVFFMRKLWFNVIPGRDTKADLIFHFPQELPKYLRGYHVCTKEEMLKIAALLFCIKVNSDKNQLVMIPKLLKELVPTDQLKAMSENEWKKVERLILESDEAKVAFLKAVHRWPTFGCAFFDVKQTSEQKFPDIVRIAISKQGLTIIHPKTKETLATHPFNRIANWSSGSTYFHMTIGNLVNGSKFLCETSLGYKMDDLISSYVNMYLSDRKTVQTRNRRFDI